MSPYDHERRAGNEGDVVKHLALFVAADLLAARARLVAFTYSDMFVGRASTTLRPGGEWDRGIHALWTRLAGRPEPRIAGFAAAALPVEPAAGRIYPGSVSVAAERIRARGRELVVKAWDVAPVCVESVRAALPGARAVLGAVEDHVPDAADADLVLFDPPKLTSWATSGRPVLEANPAAGFLGWIPARIMERTDALVEDARALGCDVVRVRYGRATTPSGCVLLLRAPGEVQLEVWRTVEALGALMGWHASRG